MRKLWIIMSLPVFLSACATTPNHISQIDEKDFEYYVEADKQAKLKNVSSTPVQLHEDNWEDTQQKNCKIFASATFKNNDQTVKFYWDGECRDGYAYGLGREFTIGKNTYIESIGLYRGGRIEPEYYYDYYEADRSMNFHGQEDVSHGRYSSLKTMLAENNILISQLEVNEWQNGDFYRVVTFHQFGKTLSQYFSSGGLNFSFEKYDNDPIIDSINTVYFGSPELTTPIFRGVIYNDGNKFFYDTRKKPEKLAYPPKKLIDIWGEKFDYLSGILKNTNYTQGKNLNSSLKMVDVYIKRICISTNFLPDVGKKNYFEICSPYKSLNRLSSQIEQGISYSNQLKKQRLEQVELAAIRNRINNQQAKQEKPSSQVSWVDIANSFSQIANSLADGYNRQADMYNNTSNNISQMPRPMIQPISPYGSKKNYNCITVGISTNCREQ